MACINCSDCSRATPPIPECTTNTIRIGTIATAGSVIIRLTNVASGAVWEGTATADLSGLAEFELSTFNDLTAFQYSQGDYKLELLSGDLVPYTITDFLGGVNTAECLLISFTPLDNSTGKLTLEF